MNRFKSRKFWLAVGTVFSIAIAELTGYDVDPASIAGIVLVISTYIVGQGLVDKSVGEAQVRGALDVGKAQLEAYVRNLEIELTKVTEALEVGIVPESLPTDKVHAEE